MPAAGPRVDRRSIVFACTLAGSVLAAACNRSPAPQPQPARSERRAEARFVGSAKCAECHPQEADRWRRSWHARALASAAPDAVAGRFDGTHYKGTSTEAWMTRTPSAFRMRTADAGGKPSDYPVNWVVGGKRMQDALTVMPDGAWQVLPVYFHVTGRGEWVDYNEARQGRVTPDHPFFWTNFRRTANHECLDCHTTGLRTGYDRNARRWETQFADAGVACESCHGPGGVHADTRSASDIVQPARVDRDVSLSICAQCHGPRQPLFPILDADHRLRPGDSYDDFYQALVIVDGRTRSGDFFADGRPNTSSYEYQALSQSRCAIVGRATCLTCHSGPHEGAGADELKAASTDIACSNCHESIFAQGTRHTRHDSPEAQSCVACHMPKVVSGVLDKFADHAIDVPIPENTVRHEVPNACATCHAKTPPSALQEQVLRLWPGAGRRQQRRLRLADAFDEAAAAGSEPALGAVVGDDTEAPMLRGAAAVLFAQRFGRDASRAVLPLLRSRDALLRSRALEALGYSNDRQYSDAVAGLLDDRALAVRLMAARVLGAWGDARSDAALRRLAADPRSTALPQPHVALGIAALQRGQYAAAVEELERALDRMPYQADALAALGDAHARQGHPDLAWDDAALALHFSPRHEPALHLRESLIRRGETGHH